jgi:hypothetical protein
LSADKPASGVQSQVYATSVLTTIRKSLTKPETAGYTPGSLVIHPTDWEGVEVAQRPHGRNHGPSCAVPTRLSCTLTSNPPVAQLQSMARDW